MRLPVAVDASPVSGSAYWDDANNKLYIYRATATAAWKYVVLGGHNLANNLTDLGDLNIGTPESGQFLRFNSTSGKWENQTSSGGGAVWGDITGTLSAQADLSNALNGKETANSNIQAHVTSAHAPSNAQKNSDILKSEIEAKLTGAISTHSHAAGLGYAINVQALTSSPADATTIYFGMLPKAPVTAAGTSKIYIRKAGTIKVVEIYCYSGTAGTAEAWSLYVRKNNTADTLIATLSVTANERIFTNSALSIAVAAGDYIEIKGIQPTWATNPATTIYGGYVYIE
jgi:hypothetical protein